MKKILISLLSLTIVNISLTNCERKNSNPDSFSDSGKKELTLNKRVANGYYSFKSGLGLGTNSYMEMNVKISNSQAEVIRSEVFGQNVEFSTFNIIGCDEIDTTETNNTLVKLREDVSYFFVPFNDSLRPVSFKVGGGAGVRFWCFCNEEPGGVGFCMTNASISNNIGTVNCGSIACTWCELKYKGMEDPRFEIPNITELGFGTIIETETLILDGETYHAR